MLGVAGAGRAPTWQQRAAHCSALSGRAATAWPSATQSFEILIALLWCGFWRHDTASHCRLNSADHPPRCVRSQRPAPGPETTELSATVYSQDLFGSGVARKNKAPSAV